MCYLSVIGTKVPLLLYFISMRDIHNFTIHFNLFVCILQILLKPNSTSYCGWIDKLCTAYLKQIYEYYVVINIISSLLGFYAM